MPPEQTAGTQARDRRAEPGVPLGRPGPGLGLRGRVLESGQCLVVARGGEEAGDRIRGREHRLPFDERGLRDSKPFLRGRGPPLGLGGALAGFRRAPLRLAAARLGPAELAADLGEPAGRLSRRPGQGGIQQALAPGRPIQDGLGVSRPVQGLEEVVLDQVRERHRPADSGPRESAGTSGRRRTHAERVAHRSGRGSACRGDVLRAGSTLGRASGPTRTGEPPQGGRRSRRGSCLSRRRGLWQALGLPYGKTEGDDGVWPSGATRCTLFASLAGGGRDAPAQAAVPAPA